jgi:hypothetical protein
MTSDTGQGDGRGVLLSPEELLEIEAALAEDLAGEVVSGDDFLRRLRAPLERSGTS